MNILEIIAKKRDGKILEKDEIDFFMTEYINGNIPDYQASALVMAIYINGMNEEETTNLTFAMVNSGEVLNFSDISDTIVDKHSTGGVGDKTTLILMPIIASMGIPVAKMSGRGLGITGGTIDKLESIPGYKTELPIEEFVSNVKKIGISIMGQTKNLVPADKKLYALRDTIACTESIPLIASSIMSKKIAAGSNKIVLEVTYGSGAFMKKKEDAIKLANMMIKLGKLANKETICVLTPMYEPLGYAIGNSLEIKEVINFLKGNMPKDIEEVITLLGAYIIKLSGKNDNIEENKKQIIEQIKSKKAYNKFVELIENQGGDISYLEDTNKFATTKYIEKIISKKEGYIEKVDAEKIGQICVELGAGRIKKEDRIDEAVGIMLNKKIGDTIKEGEEICTIYANDIDKLNEAIIKIDEAILFINNKVEKAEAKLEIIE